MPIKYVKWITREMVQAEPEARFVFGDNTVRVGLAGQAKSMRGEPNSIGVATKRVGSMHAGAFFSDKSEGDMRTLTNDLKKVEYALEEGRVVYVPFDGLGTGLSELPQRAPGLYDLLHQFFITRSEPDDPCPWPPVERLTHC